MSRAANENALPAPSRAVQAMAALEASLEAHQRMVAKGAGSIVSIAEELLTCLRAGGKILFCGNGGSAADAQHAAAELVGRFYRDRPALAALSLSTDTSVLTAVGNDWQFEDVFARQVAGLGRPGDVVVGLSTSGRSKNIVRAFEAARRASIHSVAITGREGREVSEAADLSLCVPSSETPRIQELHILALHTICELVEDGMFSSVPSLESNSRLKTFSGEEQR